MKIVGTSLALALMIVGTTAALSTANAAGSKSQATPNFAAQPTAGKHKVKRNAVHSSRKSYRTKRNPYAKRFGNPAERRWDGYRFSDPAVFW